MNTPQNTLPDLTAASRRYMTYMTHRHDHHLTLLTVGEEYGNWLRYGDPECRVTAYRLASQTAAGAGRGLVSAPTGPGQAVRTDAGELGITTDRPSRRGQIGVMLLGHPYDIRMPAEELTVVTLAAEVVE